MQQERFSLIIPISSTCFGQRFRQCSGALDCVYSLWYNAPTMLPAGNSCKHSLVLLRIGQIIARNTLRWWALWIKNPSSSWLFILLYQTSNKRHSATCPLLELSDIHLGIVFWGEVARGKFSTTNKTQTHITVCNSPIISVHISQLLFL